MPAPSASPTRWIACPQCGERLAVRPEDAGKRGRCDKCGNVFRIAAPTPSPAGVNAPPRPAAQATPAKPAAPVAELHPDFDERPALVTFPCELCATRITTATANVGRKIKCPDCGRANVVPEPAAKKAPNIPAAMAGPQYELWGVDEIPKASKSAPAAPRLHPVHCLRCGTLMYARDEHIGKKLKCPDCGALTIAKATAPAKPAVPVLVEPGEEYQLDDVQPLTVVEPQTELSAQDKALREVGTIPAVAQAMAAEKAKVVAPPKPRPVRPKNPLVTGALTMIFTQEVIARWIALSLGFGVIGQLFGETLLTEVGQGYAAAGVSIIMMIMTIFAVVFGLLWLASFGPLVIAIVGESADGNDELQQPPKLLAFDWFAELGMFVMAAMVAGVAAFGLDRLLSLTSAPPLARAAVIGASFVAILPVTLLSTLLEGTPLGVFSPKLVTTLGRCAGPWMLFYLETYLLAAVVGVVAYFLAPERWDGPPQALVWGGGFVAIAALLVDMRLLGRLAWWINDAMPDGDEDEEDDPHARAQRRRDDRAARMSEAVR